MRDQTHNLVRYIAQRPLHRSAIESQLLQGAFSGVILDIDGTLVDSNEAHALSWRRALVAAAAPHRSSNNGDPRLAHIPLSVIRKRIGMGGDQLIPSVTRECLGREVSADSDLGRLISEYRNRIFRTEFFPKIQALPGARDLVLWLHRMGLRIVVATSAERAEAWALLGLAGVQSWIAPESLVTRDSGIRSKPAPDLVEVALTRLPGGPVVMMGDTPYDIDAAKRAGIPTIGFRSGGFSDADLRAAIALYNDPRDLYKSLTQEGRTASSA